MADARIKINFNNSMTLEKRDENFAYLRQGVMKNRALALYPENGFSEWRTFGESYDYEFKGMAGDNTRPPIMVFYDNDTQKLIFKSESFTGNADGGLDEVSVAYGKDGLYAFDNYKKKVFAASYTTSSVSDYDVLGYQYLPEVEKGLFDGNHYWWVGRQIFRQEPKGDAVLIMEDTGTSGTEGYIVSVCDYREELVIFSNERTITNGFLGVGKVLFWDKTNTTLFNNRLLFKNKLIAGGGVVGGELIMVTYERKNINKKEESGTLAVYSWNGFKFNWLNEIEISNRVGGMYNNLLFVTHNSDDYLYICPNRNTKTQTTTKDELFQPYIYRVNSKGEIDTVVNTLDGNTEKNPTQSIYQCNDAIYYATGDSPIKILTNADATSEGNQQSYGTFSGSTYITNFYCNPYNYHRLQGLSLSFEKLFNLEELDVYYRDSDRKDWTKLVTIDKAEVIKGANKQNSSLSDEIQRYQITLMPNGSSLPEFHEIQFKFVSKQGFSVIGAWFEYDYITRHNIK